MRTAPEPSNHGIDAGPGYSTCLTEQEALQLAGNVDTNQLMHIAGVIRDHAYGNIITYSRKVFIPLTQLCRDVCHYCTFAKSVKQVTQPYMSVEEVLAVARSGRQAGCKEALFTLGEKPELRYTRAKQSLARMGFETTLDYLAHVAAMVFNETGLLPHINAGCLSTAEIGALRKVSASMGLMLESASMRLCGKGMPHYGSPDKHPAARLATIEAAGAAGVPFTSGILIGIGETRRERIEALLALRRLHDRYGHLQELIIQNFQAKPGTKMAAAPEPGLDDMCWTIAVARIVFGPGMNIQAPPNLNPGVWPQLIRAGINDWGGVSPVTPDFVNPEAPWPAIERLARATAGAGKHLQERMTLYPRYAVNPEPWLHQDLRQAVLRLMDMEGYPRTDTWITGGGSPPPAADLGLIRTRVLPAVVTPDIRDSVARAQDGGELEEARIVQLFSARGNDFAYLCQAADRLGRRIHGNRVSYVINRNINYTNICYYKCRFCAFSKGKVSEILRDQPYLLTQDDITEICRDAWRRGATEVCMQGGIHPEFTGDTYLEICRTVKQATPAMHVHAFSPLEVWHGAETLGISVREFLARLQQAGLSSLPGTAAEILDDEVRQLLCKDKINTRQWFEVVEAAHRLGIRTTATIMYGHMERTVHWARHLLRIKAQQQRTGGFTEFVPLPFIAAEAPIYRKGQARQGPTFREAVLMHAIARLVLYPDITNIQASWVKLGPEGVKACLQAGANDTGGTLMYESISRSAGAIHGQELTPEQMETLIRAAGRIPFQRTTFYQEIQNSVPSSTFNVSRLTTSNAKLKTLNVKG
jgi:FO synthase